MQTHSAERHSTFASGATKRQVRQLDGRARKRRRTEEEAHIRGVNKRERGKRDRVRKRKSKDEEGRGCRRKWVFSPRDCSDFKDRFVIVSYNILGVENASNHLDLYSRLPPENLNWDTRKKLIREELSLYMPSILCFQEVDRFDDLTNLLEADGYKGVYKGRTGEACDGCAVFWKEEQYTLLHKVDVEFRNFGLRENVAQLCVFKMNLNHSNIAESDGRNPSMTRNTPSRSFLVGNIHMLFNPSRGDIKLGQVRLFIEKAHALSQEWGNIPVVLAGDLNSMPKSAIYQFLASSELDILMHDRRNVSGQVEYSSRRPLGTHSQATARYLASSSNSFKFRWSEEQIQLASGSKGCTHLRHHLKLCSAYSGVPGNRGDTRDTCGEPLATSYHSKFLGTVDYIWHSEELVPVRVVETLPITVLRKMRGLPNEKWGSDHLALVCELAFADDRNKTDA